MIAANTSFTVRSAQGDYIVERHDDIASVVAAIAVIDGAFIIIDAQVAELYRDALLPLAGLPSYTLPATESEKTLAGVERALLALQSAGGNKRSVVVAIGGGITQDVSTLVAALWYRGIGYVYVPTTLLSMSDSCIGAKSAVNLGAFKNQIGPFRSPQRILVSEHFTETLADDDVRSGWGEIIKLAIVESGDAFEHMCRDVERDGFRGPSLARNIQASLETKRRVIEIDEYELDLRRILNYGHTFGHALEAVMHNAVPPALAVPWGCDLANFSAMHYGLLDAAVYRRMHEFIAEHFAFTVAEPYDADAVFETMRRDKKAAAGSVSLILPHSLGDVRIVPTPLDDRLRSIVADYIARDDIFSRDSR